MAERKILVAVDESEESAYALKWCLSNIIGSERNYKDTLVLLYAKQPRIAYTAMDSTGYMFPSDIIETMERYNNEIAQAVMDKAQHICKDLDDHVNVETLVKCGDPRDVICEAAEELTVDFLVMGSHGYGFIKRTFLGSVSDFCAQNVNCPVLIVKKPK